MWKRSLSVVLLCWAACSCKSVEIGDASNDAPLYSDDFERTAVGPQWKRGEGERGSGKWTIRDGALHGNALKNDPLWFQKPIPTNGRVTFDATALSAEGDLKVEIFGDGKNHASGYVVIFGGWSNSLDVIARLDEHGKDRKAQKSLSVKTNQTYRFDISRTPQGEIVWKIDGKRVMSYPDKKPLSGTDHRFFAFSNWNAPVRFDNFRVYAK